ncbi:hypothetical protein Scep_028401 [Stephania cephalantha]|uniref:Uncharacterized protein n=1 Tax=Stephania cephalantha TaxID=152367 RepID=A0AAP0EIA2_9MAGN
MTTDMEDRFKIEHFGRIGEAPIYKLSYCPTVCSTCEKALCKDIGVHSDDKDGFQRLVLTDDFPIVVRFKKA